MLQSYLIIILQAKDEASKTLKRFSGEFNKIGKQAKQAGLLIGGFATAIGTKAVLSASNFEKSMASVSTLVDTGTESMEKMKKEVLD